MAQTDSSSRFQDADRTAALSAYAGKACPWATDITALQIDISLRSPSPSGQFAMFLSENQKTGCNPLLWRAAVSLFFAFLDSTASAGKKPVSVPYFKNPV